MKVCRMPQNIIFKEKIVKIKFVCRMCNVQYPYTQWKLKEKLKNNVFKGK